MADLLSVILYFFVFFISILILHVLKNTYQYKNVVLGSININFFYTSFLVLFTCLPLVVLATVRYGIGTDYFSYSNDYYLVEASYYSLDDFSFLLREVGYTFTTWLAINIFDSYQGVLFFSAWLTTVPVLVALLLYNSKYIEVGWLIYLLTLYLSSFNGIRQHIAVSFAFLAIVLIYKKATMKGIICILVGFLFHQTAIIALAFLLFSKFSSSNATRQKAVLIFSFIAGLMSLGLVVKILEVFPLFAFYLEKYELTFNEMSLTHYVVHTAFKIPLLMIVVWYYNKLCKKNKQNFALLSFLLLDVLFVFSSYYLKWAIRLQYYTMCVYPLITMNILDNDYIRNNKKYIVMFLIAVYIIRFLAIFGFARYDGVIPYDFRL